MATFAAAPLTSPISCKLLLRGDAGSLRDSAMLAALCAAVRARTTCNNVSFADWRSCSSSLT